MTTTHHNRQDLDSNVVSLAEHRARRRAQLDHLLELRDRLAGVAAERRSHDLDDAWLHDLELYRVERLIADGWPDVYEQRFTSWLEGEHLAEHDPGALLEGCGICAAIASTLGVNLTRPQAG